MPPKTTDLSSPEAVEEFYLRLLALPEKSRARGKRRRGYQFQNLIAAALALENLEPRTSYRTVKGAEEIDGSFFLDGTIFLIEAKWHAEPLPASTLYMFKGKIDGKLVGTLGVFISMSGYSKAAADALTFGKNINLILFDRPDMDAAILRKEGFRAVLKRKLRDAAEAGIVQTPSSNDVVRVTPTVETARYDASTGRVLDVVAAVRSSPDLVIVCEGDTDRTILSMLSERILADSNSTPRWIKIITAMGKRPVARVTRTFQYHYPENVNALLIVDGDGDIEGSLEMLESEVAIKNWRASIPDPGIEAWFADFDFRPMRMRRQEKSGIGTMSEFQEAIKKLDIEKLLKSDQSFAVFYNAVLGREPDTEKKRSRSRRKPASP
ncbi:restriction endonuclease [Rhizobium sp. 60-20]|uniref:restriction endonuclease n=1 Tax=Rhizobium sp. 60-20 TaxID=1895819 RepID=UPI000B09423A|nr:restriction endonuclease [Rhizobium sp. 60-20]